MLIRGPVDISEAGCRSKSLVLIGHISRIIMAACIGTGNNQQQIRPGRSAKSAANTTIHPLEGATLGRMRQADYLITANP